MYHQQKLHEPEKVDGMLIPMWQFISRKRKQNLSPLIPITLGGSELQFCGPSGGQATN